MDTSDHAIAIVYLYQVKMGTPKMGSQNPGENGDGAGGPQNFITPGSLVPMGALL
jgi:hypothetical protein